MFIFPIVQGHLSWEAKQFSGHFAQLYWESRWQVGHSAAVAGCHVYTQLGQDELCNTWNSFDIYYTRNSLSQ